MSKVLRSSPLEAKNAQELPTRGSKKGLFFGGFGVLQGFEKALLWKSASELPRKAERCLRALLGGGGVGSAGGERRLRLGHTREGDGMLGRSKNIGITLQDWKIWLVGFVV